MKKIRLGKFNAKVLSERELKNVLGGLEAPSSTVVTKSKSGTTMSLAANDGDNEEGDIDWNIYDKT